MRKILSIILALSLWSCQSTPADNNLEIPEGKGELRSSLVSGEATDDIISLIISQGETVIEQWNDMKKVPEVIYLVPGDYTITAKTDGDMLQVSDKPYYNASTTFTIVEGEVAYASLECKILNMKVTLELSEALQTEFPDWQADFFFLENMDVVFTSLNAETNRAIYITPAPFGVTLKDVATAESRTVIFEESGAAMYHNVKFE